MCGITGKINFNKEKFVSENLIKEMVESLSHRGPDDQGIFVKGNIGLGHNRLSIIDLSLAGHQPMSDNEEKIWIVYNGEIYNFLDLRSDLEKQGVIFKSKTDTEVIIYLYKKYGIDCLKYLRGMFAFAIWDSQKKIIFLARDRVGKKPLKYYLDSNCFIFASELKAIFKNPEVKKEIDLEAIDEYLTYQYVPHPKTGFKNIKKLAPASYLIINSTGEIIEKKYWNLDYSQKLDISEAEWEKKIFNTLNESVRLRLISDVPLGAHLSGGIDSSLIVALMAQNTIHPIKTFSIGFKEKDYNELPFAQMVAQKYKTEHHEFIVKPNVMEILPQLVYHYEEPYADSSALPTWYLSKLTKKHVTVALNGDGGDENFAGYTRYNAAKLFRQINLIPFKSQIRSINQILYQITGIKLFRKGYRFFDSYNQNFLNFHLNLIDYFSQEDKDRIYSSALKDKVKNSRWYSFIEEIYNETASSKDWLDKLLYIDFNSYLANDLLVKIDIASMAHALEIRSPFLDQKFLELTSKMPSILKLRGHNKKYILKKLAYKYLPKKCIDRPKQGFGAPLEHWLKGEMEGILKDRLLNENFLKFGFKKDGIEKMILEHKSRKQNNANQLWALLTLSEWLRQNF